MLIKIPFINCQRIDGLSWYNNNYYRLPFDFDGCDTVFEKYCGAEELEEISLGNIIDGKYIAKWHLHDDAMDDIIKIDTEKIYTENRYT